MKTSTILFAALTTVFLAGSVSNADASRGSKRVKKTSKVSKASKLKANNSKANYKSSRVATTKLVIGALGNPLPHERRTATVIQLNGKVSKQEMFKKVYPAAAKLGHKWGSKNVYGKLSAQYLDKKGNVLKTIK